MKGNKLTPKQERFCQLIVSGKNLTEAYLGSYSPKTKNKNSINREAKEVYDNLKISSRINELREKQIEKLNYSVKQSFDNLVFAQQKAIEEENINAYIKAEELKGKLAGLYNITEKANIVAPIQIVINNEDKNC